MRCFTANNWIQYYSIGEAATYTSKQDTLGECRVIGVPIRIININLDTHASFILRIILNLEVSLLLMCLCQ